MSPQAVYIASDPAPFQLSLCTSLWLCPGTEAELLGEGMEPKDADGRTGGMSFQWENTFNILPIVGKGGDVLFGLLCQKTVRFENQPVLHTQIRSRDLAH